jgi:hypothetical protein
MWFSLIALTYSPILLKRTAFPQPMTTKQDVTYLLRMVTYTIQPIRVKMDIPQTVRREISVTQPIRREKAVISIGQMNYPKTI